MKYLWCAVVAAIAQPVHSQVAPICVPPGTRSGSLATQRPHDDSLWKSTRRHSLVGEVVTIEGVPLESALLRLRGPSPDTTTVAGRMTKPDGRFAFADLAATTYVLEVSRIGYLRQRHEIHAVPAGADTVCIRLRITNHTLAPVGIGGGVITEVRKKPRGGR